MSEGFELIALPLETIILSDTFSSFTRRASFQSDSSTKSISSVQELRIRFEDFLSQTEELKETFLYNIQKLVFLDYFYDCKKKKAIEFKENAALLRVCNSFLGAIIKASSEQVMVNETNSLENSFLAQFKEIVEENSSMFPLFKNQSVYEWFLKKQKEINQPKQAKEDDSVLETAQDDELEMLLFMFTNHFMSLFYYFQKNDSKFVLQWMKQKLSSLPKYILDELKVKHETRQSFKELLVYKEEELNSSTVLDADFEFLKFLSSNTSDWKLQTKYSNALDLHVYSSKENYMSTPKSRTLKFVYVMDNSVAEYSKAYLSFDFSKEKMVNTTYKTYEPMDISNSSKKYSIVKGDLLFDPNIPFIAKRTSEGVFSSKAKFIGKQLAETLFIFKTSSLENNQRCMAMGGMVFRKLDETKCLVIEIKMFYVSGILQTDLVMDNFGLKIYMKQLKDLTQRMIKQMKEENHSNRLLVWKTFCDYCQYHYSIDANSLLLSNNN